MRSVSATRSGPGDWQTKIGPDVRVASTSMPRRSSSSRPASTTRGSGANGFVSVAVTKIASGFASGRGIRPKGRVRKAGHSPRERSASREVVRSGADALPEPSSAGLARIVKLERVRRGPGRIDSTTPSIGETKAICGRAWSVKRACPAATRSPSATANRGRRPGQSEPSSATEPIGGPSLISCNGFLPRSAVAARPIRMVISVADPSPATPGAVGMFDSPGTAHIEPRQRQAKCRRSAARKVKPRRAGVRKGTRRAISRSAGPATPCLYEASVLGPAPEWHPEGVPTFASESTIGRTTRSRRCHAHRPSAPLDPVAP